MDFANPHFEEPRWLLLAIAAPVLLSLIHRYAARARRRQLARVASLRFVDELTRSHSPARRGFKNALLVIAVAFIGLAMARPQWGEVKSVGAGPGEDVMFAVDCSQSMLATDVLPNRLERSKLAILNYVHRHAHGRVGLAAFSGASFLQCPLTHDYDAFEQALQAMDDKLIPIPGTDIGGALEEAWRAMDKKSRRKVVVLVTDGEDLEKGGVKTAQMLATNGVVVFALGVGTAAGSEIRVLNQAGQQELLRDAQGEIVRSRLDEETLRAIAEATGGQYHPLGARGEGLARVRLAVDAIGRADGLTRTRGVERFHLFIAAALLLLVVESLLGTRRGGQASPIVPFANTGAQKTAVATACLCLCLTAAAATNVSTNVARSASATTPKTARDFYNAGTQRLSDGKLNEAETFFQTALARQVEPIQSATLYNLGHVRFAQGEAELKKSPSAKSIVERNRALGQRGARAVQLAEAAMADRDLQKMIEAYQAGRGARREARAVIEAFNRAMETHGATLRKWTRSLGDFKSAAELNPADTNAVHNARVVELAIEKLLDEMRQMQQAMMPMPGGASQFNQMMNDLKGQIPADMMPPGAPGDDDEDMPSPFQFGRQEGAGREGEEREMPLTPDEAGDLLQGLKLNEKHGLPGGMDRQGKPIDRTGRNW
ncbi:MAG TPA: VWA domain-containing protein [Verrucomicrobiota bacterium]|nr:VWA domain-containing protein [Verrucomicrobiota bacterium]